MKPSPPAFQRRFFAPPAAFQKGKVVLGPEETHHLHKVLRLGPGAKVEVYDGQGRNFAAVVHKIEAGGALLQVLEELAPWGESPLDLTLGIGLAKGEALDAVVRQATEMGVKLIIPFTSERSEQVTPERAARRLLRWQRLTQESLKSCRRSLVPRIEEPVDFTTALSGPETLKLLFWEEELGGGLKAFLSQPRPQSVRVLIGPEGGFSPKEAAQAQDAGFAVVSLGPRLLKVPTAALAALTLIQYAWGDLA
ncbi:MAG: RsmE family RNA methyltransferase [Syntrophales bacterium]|nr:RsmE family RNA methyltransferase [Syntrophales bacterium]MDD5642471.1 RsmE family RNA methyltransferase [Syntrophales bacterium]